MIVKKFHYKGERIKHVYHDFSDSHPDEDYAAWRSGKFAVFDGVTIQHQRPYPMPSPAAQVAELACEVVIKSDFDIGSPEKSMDRVVRAVNSAVRDFNESRGVNGKNVNHLDRQYAAAVGAFGFIVDDGLYCAQLNDSEVAVLYRTGGYKFRLQTDRGPIQGLLEYHRRRGDFKPDSPQEHVFARSRIINNPDLVFENQQIRAGVFTGEDIAGQFVNTGSAKLSAGDTILFFSDGMLPFIKDEKFRHFLAGTDNWDKLDELQAQSGLPKDERTIIIVRFQGW